MSWWANWSQWNIGFVISVVVKATHAHKHIPFQHFLGQFFMDTPCAHFTTDKLSWCVVISLFVSLQDSCTRVLLFRGANKEIKNYNSQTAFQVRAQDPWVPGGQHTVQESMELDLI